MKGRVITMSVNGIYNTTTNEAYTTKASTTTSVKTDSTDSTTVNDTNTKTETTEGAVYEKTKLSEDDRKAIVNQLKADQEKRMSQLTSLVNDMISKQSSTFNTANGIWNFLAKGDFTVDAQTKQKAQDDISEDGYWGVNQTSDRIVDFAQALAGDDSDALEKMKSAFEKGFNQAEKAWGGKLPDISQRTYDAVMKKFDKLLKPTSDKNTDEKANTSQDATVVIKDNQEFQTES